MSCSCACIREKTSAGCKHLIGPIPNLISYIPHTVIVSSVAAIAFGLLLKIPMNFKMGLIAKISFITCFSLGSFVFSVISIGAMLFLQKLAHVKIHFCNKFSRYSNFEKHSEGLIVHFSRDLSGDTKEDELENAGRYMCGRIMLIAMIVIRALAVVSGFIFGSIFFLTQRFSSYSLAFKATMVGVSTLGSSLFCMGVDYIFGIINALPSTFNEQYERDCDENFEKSKN